MIRIEDAPVEVVVLDFLTPEILRGCGPREGMATKAVTAKLAATRKLLRIMSVLKRANCWVQTSYTTCGGGKCHTSPRPETGFCKGALLHNARIAPILMPRIQ